MKSLFGYVIFILLLIPFSSAQWTRPAASGSSSGGTFTWFGSFNVSDNISTPVLCLGSPLVCQDTWISVPADGNNYTSSIGFNYTSIGATLNLQRVGMSNLSAYFPFPVLSESHTNLTQNNTCDWDIDLINIPAGFSDGVDDEGENWYPTAGVCTNQTTFHNCTVSGSGMPSFWFTLSDTDTDTDIYPVSFSVTGSATKNYSVLLSNGTYIWVTAVDIDTDTFNTSSQFRAAVNNSGTYNISINSSNILNAPWLTSYSETDPQVVSLTSNQWCRANSTGTGINCDVSPVTDTDIYPTSAAVTGTSTKNATVTLNNGTVLWGTFADIDTDTNTNCSVANSCPGIVYSGNTSWVNGAETDPQVQATTAGMWCQGNGTAVTCNVSAITATGSGNLTGSGATGWLASWTNASNLNRSSIYDDGANVNISANLNIGNGASAGSISNNSGNFQINATNKVVINKGLDVQDTCNATNFYMGGLLVATQSWTTSQNYYPSTNPNNYWNACANVTACGYLTSESDPQVVSLTMNQWCRANSSGTGINCDVAPVTDTDTFNTSTQMIAAVNASTGYFSNMKNAWANLQGVPADIADGDADTNTWNSTSEMITAVNTSTGYFSNMKNDWNKLQNVPAGFADGTDADTDTWNSTAEMVTAINGTGYFNNIRTDWADIQNVPAGFADGTDADTDTWNTSTQMISSVNTSTGHFSNMKISCSNVYFGSTLGSAGICDGTDDGTSGGSGNVTGTGVAGWLAGWTNSSNLNRSSIYDDGRNVNISANLNVGNGASAGSISNVSGSFQINATNKVVIDKGLEVLDTANATNFFMGGNLVATQAYVTGLGYLSTESDPQVQLTTAGAWCQGNGSAVTCNASAPAGTGDGTGGWTNTTTNTTTTLNVSLGSGLYLSNPTAASYPSISAGLNPDSEKSITLRTTQSADFYLGTSGFFNIYSDAGLWQFYVSNAGAVTTRSYGTAANWYQAYQRTAALVDAGKWCQGNGTGMTCNVTPVVDTDTNAGTICTGTSTYLDGEGSCDTVNDLANFTDAGNAYQNDVGADCGAGAYAKGVDDNGALDCATPTDTNYYPTSVSVTNSTSNHTLTISGTGMATITTIFNENNTCDWNVDMINLPPSIDLDSTNDVTTTSILTYKYLNSSNATTCGASEYSYFNGTGFQCRADLTGAAAGDGTGGWTNITSDGVTGYTYTSLNVSILDNLRNGRNHSIVDVSPKYLQRMSIEFYSATIYSFEGFGGAAISSGTVSSGTNTQNHQGTLTIRDSTTANGGYYGNGNAMYRYFQGGEYFMGIFYDVSRNGTAWRLGWGDSVTVSLDTDGCMFNKGPGNGSSASEDDILSGYCSNNSVRTYTSANYTMTDTAWYNAFMIVQPGATQVNFYLYDDAKTLLWQENITSNIPRTSGRDFYPLFIATENSTNAAADIIGLDYLSWDLPTPTTRFRI